MRLGFRVCGALVNGFRMLNSQGEGSQTQRCPRFHCDLEETP